jgi:hypothetical protein
MRFWSYFSVEVSGVKLQGRQKCLDAVASLLAQVLPEAMRSRLEMTRGLGAKNLLAEEPGKDLACELSTMRTFLEMSPLTDLACDPRL